MWQQCITTIAADFPVRKILANGKRSRFLTNLVPNLTQLTVIQDRWEQCLRQACAALTCHLHKLNVPNAHAVRLHIRHKPIAKPKGFFTKLPLAQIPNNGYGEYASNGSRS